MKKIIGVIITALLLVNCSHSDDNKPNKNSKRLVKIVSDDIHQNSSGKTTSKSEITTTIKYGSNGFVSQIESLKVYTEDGKTENFVDLMTYTYNSSNQLTEERANFSNEINITIYTYKNGLIISSVEKSGKSIDEIDREKTHTYLYKNNRLVERVTKYDNTSDTEKVFYEQDANGNMTKEDGPISTITYSYNNKSNPTYSFFPPVYLKIDAPLKGDLDISKNVRIKWDLTFKDKSGRVISRGETSNTTYEYNSEGLPIKAVQTISGKRSSGTYTSTMTYEYE